MSRKKRTKLTRIQASKLPSHSIEHYREGNLLLCKVVREGYETLHRWEADISQWVFHSRG